MPADVVLHNAKGRHNRGPSFVEAVAIQARQGLAAGTMTRCYGAGPATLVIDAQGGPSSPA